MMDLERAITPTRQAQRAASGWRAAGAVTPERLRRGIGPGARHRKHSVANDAMSLIMLPPLIMKRGR